VLSTLYNIVAKYLLGDRDMYFFKYDCLTSAIEEGNNWNYTGMVKQAYRCR
jgi:hypothetical protein